MPDRTSIGLVAGGAAWFGAALATGYLGRDHGAGAAGAVSGVGLAYFLRGIRAQLGVVRKRARTPGGAGLMLVAGGLGAMSATAYSGPVWWRIALWGTLMGAGLGLFLRTALGAAVHDEGSTS